MSTEVPVPDTNCQYTGLPVSECKMSDLCDCHTDGIIPEEEKEYSQEAAEELFERIKKLALPVARQMRARAAEKEGE